MFRGVLGYAVDLECARVDETETHRWVGGVGFTLLANMPGRNDEVDHCQGRNYVDSGH